MRPSNRRKTDRRRISKIVEETVDADLFKERTKVNIENVRLLLADPDFVNWVVTVRKRCEVPDGGFKNKKATLKKWLDKRDENLWSDSVAEVFVRYTKINERYLPYVESFILHNYDFRNSAIEPMPSYRLGQSEYFFKKLFKFGTSKKLPQLRLEIYAPPTNDQWAAIKKDVTKRFEEFGIYTGSKMSKPLKTLNLKIAALKVKEPIDQTTMVEGDDYPAIETDQIIIDGLYPKASKSHRKKLASQLAKERVLTKDLLVSRLGKTDI